MFCWNVEPPPLMLPVAQNFVVAAEVLDPSGLAVELSLPQAESARAPPATRPMNAAVRRVEKNAVRWPRAWLGVTFTGRLPPGQTGLGEQIRTVVRWHRR